MSTQWTCTLCTALLLASCVPNDGGGDGREVASITEWPGREVRFITHSSPGGGGDVMARELVRTLQSRHSVTATVENRVGGSGAVATVYLATRAPRDGSVLQVVTPTMLITPSRTRGIPTYRDVTPVANLLLDPTVLYVRAASPYATMEQLLGAARQDPGSLTWGIGSAGSWDHIVIEEVEEAAGITVRTVPHEGGGDAMISVLGGHVDAGLGEPAKILSQLQAGNIRLLTVFQRSRLQAWPEVPTFTELGYPVVSRKFRGVWGPPGLSEAAVAIIAGELRELMDLGPLRQYIHEGGLETEFLVGQEFVDFLEETDAAIQRRLEQH